MSNVGMLLKQTPSLTGKLSLSSSQLSARLSNPTMRGYSAYEIAVQNGFVGTEKEWLDSLENKAEFRVVGTVLEYRCSDDEEWIRLIDLSLANDYELLSNKPSIENVALSGNKTLGQIGVGNITPQEIDEIIYGGML